MELTEQEKKAIYDMAETLQTTLTKKSMFMYEFNHYGLLQSIKEKMKK